MTVLCKPHHASLLVLTRESWSHGWVVGASLLLPRGSLCPEFVSLQEWNPHYFVLTSSKIYYSGETTSDQGNEDEEEQKEVRAPLCDSESFT